VCQSQLNDELRDLLSPLGTGDFDRDIYVILDGYIDESMSSEEPPLSFCLSCVFAEGSQWGRASMAWRKVIEDKNRELISAGRKPIKRFHATDLSNFSEDFLDWNGEERNAFTSEFIKRVFNRHEIFGSAYTVSLKDISQVWPQYSGKEISAAYYCLMKLNMINLANVVEQIFSPQAKISLIYERCPYGGVILEAFNSVVDDPTCEWRHKFTTLAPMGWENCTPLQPADLLAYEVMKECLRQKPEVIAVKKRERRISLNAILDAPNFLGDAYNVTLDNLQNIKASITRKSNAVIESARL